MPALPLIVYTHTACAGHAPRPDHPERPERLQAALDGIEQLDDVDLREALPAANEQIERVHPARYRREMEQVEARIVDTNRSVPLDPDTSVGPGSFEAIRRAAGGACQAARASLVSKSSAFALVRPPGHHAESERAMGFCVYNSIAIAAAEALSMTGVARVAICDFDVHHGNGTEAIFNGREDVLFLSSHQSPLYPGTGDPAHPVAPNVINTALPPGSGSNEFRDAWLAELLPPLDRFEPDLILVSAGFDARSHCNGSLAASLEGGYDLKALTDSVLAFSEGITFTH